MSTVRTLLLLLLLSMLCENNRRTTKRHQRNEHADCLARFTCTLEPFTSKKSEMAGNVCLLLSACCRPAARALCPHATYAGPQHETDLHIIVSTWLLARAGGRATRRVHCQRLRAPIRAPQLQGHLHGHNNQTSASRKTTKIRPPHRCHSRYGTQIAPRHLTSKQASKQASKQPTYLPTRYLPTHLPGVCC